MVQGQDDIHVFSDGIKINNSIPRTMTVEGLHYLGKLAQSVPENGTIVEVGPLYGSSTWVLAKNSAPSVKIYSIDTWDPQPWIKKRLPDALEFGLDSFRHYVRDCENVTPIQGWSPQVVEDTWDRPIDLFFDDATHGDPGFSANMNFFLPFVKDDGILCGDDYASGWPDIIRVVNKLAKSWNVTPEVNGRCWAVLKNGGRGTPHNSIADKIGPWCEADLTLTTRSKSGYQHKSQPRTWTGRILENDPLTGVGIFTNGVKKVSGKFDLYFEDGNVSKGLAFDAMHQFEKNITNISVCLDKDYEKEFTVKVQGCEIIRATPNCKTMNTSSSGPGKLLKKDDETPLSALRLQIENRVG
ncbi:class I SAM-dependent methyltransferase [Roseibium sp. SCP14]|uniref:class I SAM-dependent methyltransferase n=1 Tax=Roseibium sp. SCP14 TaxID=3141375 RepID=UPI00333DE52B